VAKILRRLAVLAVLGLLVVGGYGAWYAMTPVRAAVLPVELEIPAGIGLRGTVRRLEQVGIEVGRKRFEALARLLGTTQDIKAGYYRFSVPMTPREILEKLERGDVVQSEVVLVEGWTFAQFRAALEASHALRHDSRGLADGEILARIGATERHPEGLFFPDTYLFARGSSDLAVLRRAYRVMREHLEREWAQRMPDAPFKTPYDALIMASIVEKETGRAAEREQIAGVLVNRLRVRMTLQADPTVIYGLGENFDGNLKKVHLKTDSPYNTYTRRGLPPTPIAMPGLASLRATLQPAKLDALYYVSRGDGSSEFSRTLKEHNRAVAKYQLKPKRK
jgi:UPF0755 protein